MPQGNVGTPTRHFLEEIQKCRLPGRLVGRLGLRFGGRRPGRYGSVPFDYERLPPDDRELQEDEEEEWDRHEALHDNVTEQERAKERLYEEEQEVTWEKGGPGIVWYTDACRWKEDEGDFDEQTADDWDVDVGVYYRDGDGDKVTYSYVPHINILSLCHIEFFRGLLTLDSNASISFRILNVFSRSSKFKFEKPPPTVSDCSNFI